MKKKPGLSQRRKLRKTTITPTAASLPSLSRRLRRGEKKGEKKDERGDSRKTLFIQQLSQASQEKKDQLLQYQQDLSRANQIQFHLLPEKIPRVKGVDLRVIYQSSKEVGGDYYDFITVDREHLGIVVADVSGKGVPAAMVMAMTRAFLRLLAKKERSPRYTLIRLNKYLARDIQGIMFVTMVYMVLNVLTKEMKICNAGHNPILLKNQSSLQILNPPGIALGLDTGSVFNQIIREETLQLQSGDRVLVYTDGVTEAMNEQGEEFGEEPLVEILQEHYLESSQKFLQRLMKRIQEHQGEAEQHDDITVLSFLYREES